MKCPLLLLLLLNICVLIFTPDPPPPSSPRSSILPTKRPTTVLPVLLSPPFPRHSPGTVALCKLPLLCKVGLARAFPCPSPAPEDGAPEVTGVEAAEVEVAVEVVDNILLPVRGLRLERSESELWSDRRRQSESERERGAAAPAPSELRRLTPDSRGSTSRARPEGAPLLQSRLRPPGGRSGSAASERLGLPSLLPGGARLPRCHSNLEARFP